MTSPPLDLAAVAAGVFVRVLGPLEVERDGAPVDLPPSRKARALLAYLCLASHAVTRSELCDLLWEGADDPRAELRWTLSRLRRALGDRVPLVVRDDTIRLDFGDNNVDARALDAALRGRRVSELDPAQCQALASLFRGDALRGLDLDDRPRFGAWLTAQRHRYRTIRAELLERLAMALPEDEALPYLEQWRQLSPFDPRVHQALMNALVRRGRVEEAEQQMNAAAQLFQDEGLDTAPLHAAWQAARALAATRVAPAAAIGVAPGESRGPEQQPRATAAAHVAPSAGPRATDHEMRATATDSVIARTAAPARRASIAVMPFAGDAGASQPGATGDALAHDVITRLAKLRTLFVIAPGSVFELRERGLAPAEAARMLDVDYVVGGTLRGRGEQLRVDVELTDARAGRVVWADTLQQRRADALAVLDEIGDRLVASVAGEVEAIERNRAVLKPPSSLDAWESHHRGLWHMYRFNEADNARARHFFETAVKLDPTFSRAWAGLSFTYWQNAFQGWSERGPAVERAFETAGQGLLADERDPAAHWAMGRALWLRSRHEPCVLELEQAIDLSPNFALAHYTLAFVHAQAGDASAAIQASDVSRRLSPYDPLLFGMLGARAMALVRMERFDEAAAVAVQAAARPNAHIHIQAIAAFSLALADALPDAQTYAAAIRTQMPAYSAADFFAAFRFDAKGIAAFRAAAKRLGMD